MKIALYRLSALAALVACCIVPVVAQKQKSPIHPSYVRKSGAAVKESNRSFSPPIVKSYELQELEPENPAPPIQVKLPAEGSSYAVGEADILSARVKPSVNFPGISATGYVPPDPNIGVGTTQVVQVVNAAVAVYAKSNGKQLFQRSLTGSSGWFGSVGAGGFVFDPKAWFDPVAKRFYVVALDLDERVNRSRALVAVSATDDAMGTWYKYNFDIVLHQGSNQYWMDYPSLGAGRDAITICGNMFALPGSSGFGGTQMIVLPKAAMLAGQAVTFTSLVDPQTGSTQIARSYDANLPDVLAVTLIATNQVRVYSVDNPLSTPTLNFADVTVPDFSTTMNLATSTNGRQLDTIDFRAFNVAYRGGRLLFAHNAGTSKTDSRPMVRWTQIDTNGWPAKSFPSYAQGGNIKGVGGDCIWSPAINTNKAGDISVIFSRSSATTVADLMIATRITTDKAGSLSTPVRLEKSAGASYGGSGGNRWGDYFAAEVDPTDDRTFWGTGMIGDANGNWQTIIDSWTVSHEPSDLFPSSVSLYFGNRTIGVADKLTTVDGNSYSVLSKIDPLLGQTAGYYANFIIPNNRLGGQALGLTLTGKTALDSSVFVDAYNWTSGRYDHLKATPAGASLSVIFVDFGPSFANYIDAGGSVRLVVRALIPFRKGLQPFFFDSDQLKLNVTQ